MSAEKIPVLLAEDDPILRQLIAENLKADGYEVIACADGEAAWQWFKKNKVAICLLDLMMPRRDGFSLIRKIRSNDERTPLLVISAQSMEEDILKAFDFGADDYVTKPFSMKELKKRMEVFLRRSKQNYADQPVEFTMPGCRFSFTDLKIYKGDSTIINLTSREGELLLYLCRNPNKLLKREDILVDVWGKNDHFTGRSMDVFINRLRAKMKDCNQLFLETIRNTGVRLNFE